ncbi:NAD(P)-dependent oxidoreductase [Nonomuraea spiralis]|uniref:NAD(P)-dependent oxidoreductase n=1 Tax=Nonomuraea spiralis TaxID=46182 RepID=A0ABV5IVS5_9ACTN|nr:NAD(P)-binding domain-containing protein [Nonomuraea spiralis]GGS92314.1 3-hydroxyisobutyrate dehydrogenase [Nonomuraea spiralis]
MTKNPRTPVTVLGLGLMGEALAGAFLREGHPATVWNRTAAKADRLAGRGATRAGSARDAVAAAPLVLVCLTGYDAVHEVLGPLGDVLDGRVVVNLTSGTSAEARDTAAWVERQGGTYLDGAIMAIPDAIGTPDAAVLYSGPRAAFDLHERALGSLGGTATYLGADHGLSALYDVGVLSLMWNILNGFLQGAALLGAAGVEATAFAPVARNGIETVAGWLAGYARQIDDGVHPAADSTLDTHLAAMEHLVQESESHGVDAGLPRFIRALAAEAVAAGRGGEGYTALIDRFRKPSDHA